MSKVPVAYLTRRETISAAHRLYNHNLSEEENVKIYGKCAHIHGHGHNYTVEVTLRGPVDVKTGMVMNLTDLKTCMDLAIMNTLDHKNIDKDVAFFSDRVSTTENVAIFIWEQLVKTMLNPGLLHEVKVFETEKNIVTYRGEHM